MRLLKVGRDSSCNIVLNSDRVSALHAEITVLNNGDILLEDKNSRNGTFVMNRQITPGSQVPIKRGDAIRFADVELIWDQVPRSEDLSGYKAIFGIGSSLRNDIQVSGRTVSRYHATLKIDKKGKAFLEDHSMNGTTVNGERLNSGQTRQIKKSDAVVCGGVPVNLSQFIPGNPLKKVLAATVSAAALIAAVVIPDWSGLLRVSPVSPKAIENAAVCVYGGYYYVIDVEDDPFKSVIKDWPDKWYMGYDSDGELEVDINTEDLNPIPYTGTAFFISKEGEMGTNRHIAVPWEYRKENEETIRHKMEIERQATSGFLYDLLLRNVMNNRISAEDASAWLSRYQNSPLKISGKHSYFAVGLTGTKVNSLIDLQQAQVIAESGDPEKDVALIRLNSRKTPEYLIEMKAIFDIEKARLDEKSLKPQGDELTIICYPMGELLATQTFDGKELRPTIHKAFLSKTPDDNKIQIQAMGVGGQSGSPVIDRSHRLVGVLCSGFTGTEFTYCCNIKHLKEIYDKHKARE